MKAHPFGKRFQKYVDTALFLQGGLCGGSLVSCSETHWYECKTDHPPNKSFFSCDWGKINSDHGGLISLARDWCSLWHVMQLWPIRCKKTSKGCGSGNIVLTFQKDTGKSTSTSPTYIANYVWCLAIPTSILWLSGRVKVWVELRGLSCGTFLYLRYNIHAINCTNFKNKI